MRFVNLIVILQAIRARADPIQPRQFDLNGDFGFGSESIGEDLAYTPTEDAVNLAEAFSSESPDNAGFTISDLAIAPDSGLGTGGFSAESLDLANLIPADTTSTTSDNPADVFTAQPETPAIVADVPTTGLGVTNGDLIASVDIPSNSIQFVGFLPGSENVEPFTPGPGTEDILKAADNPSFSTSSSPLPVDTVPDTSASSLDNVELKDVGFVAPPEGVEPFTPTPGIQDILNAADNPPSFSTSDSPIVANANIGSSAPSTITTPGSNPFTPGPGTEELTKPAENPVSGDSDKFTSPIAGTPFGAGVNPATLTADDLNLSTFKAGTETLATDVKLPPDIQEYFERITKAPLTQNDWKIITGNLNTGGQSQAPGSTTSSQTLSGPATQALRGLTLSPQSQRTLQSNTGFDFAGVGSSFLRALINVAQTAAQRAVISNSDQVQIQRVPVAVPVTLVRPVAVPVTLTLVRGVRVPVTVISTLPGGIVTRILILPERQPTPSTLLTSQRPRPSGSILSTVTATKTSTNTTPSSLPPVRPNVVAAPGT